MHISLLNAMMASTCPSRNMKDRKISYFRYDLHCAEMHVIARLVRYHGEEAQYEILGYKIVPEAHDMTIWMNLMEANHSIVWDM